MRGERSAAGEPRPQVVGGPSPRRATGFWPWGAPAWACSPRVPSGPERPLAGDLGRSWSMSSNSRSWGGHGCPMDGWDRGFAVKSARGGPRGLAARGGSIRKMFPKSPRRGPGEPFLLGYGLGGDRKRRTGLLTGAGWIVSTPSFVRGASWLSQRPRRWPGGALPQRGGRAAVEAKRAGMRDTGADCSA